MPKRERKQHHLSGRREAPAGVSGGDGEQRRDLTARSYSIRASTVDVAKRTVDAVLASEDPVRVFDLRTWSVIREILVIDGMRVPAQVPLLDSHNRDSIKQQLGSTRNIRIEGGKLVGTRHLSAVADAEDAFTKIREGHLTDGSVGYRVTAWQDLKPGEAADIAGRKYQNTGADVLRISHEWALMEDSLTPIGADPAAKVRDDSIPSTITNREAPPAPNTETPMNPFKQWLAARGLALESLTDAQRAPLQADFDAETARAAAAAKPAAAQPVLAPAVAPGDEVARAAELIRLRLEKQIGAVAESHGLRASDFIECKTLEEAIAKMAAKRAETEAQRNPGLIAGGVSRINYDQADKARDAFVGALANQAGIRSDEFAKLQKDNPLVGRGMQHAIRRYAKLMGVNTEEWSRQDVAFFALGRLGEMSAEAQRSAANISTASFPSFVMLNAVTKVIAKGFEMGSQASRYKDLVDEQSVPDFKQFSIGGLSTGNLQKTAENVAFPELAKSEGVYNSTVNMWGGTLSLSLQALINDDTSQFDRSLRQAGPIADKTIDRRVFQKLLMGTSAAEATSTWTSNTTSGGSLVFTTQDLMAAARGKLAVARAGMANKVGKDGNPLGNLPRFLVVPTTREMEALAIVGGSGPGLAGGEQQQILRSLMVIGTPWLEAAALTGYSTTSYYLVADPKEVTGLVLSKIRGFESIQVTPYDAGAVAALSWKLWHPFEADAVYDLVGASATKIFPGLHQATT
jgi:hypothetical protein